MTVTWPRFKQNNMTNTTFEKYSQIFGSPILVVHRTTAVIIFGSPTKFLVVPGLFQVFSTPVLVLDLNLLNCLQPDLYACSTVYQLNNPYKRILSTIQKFGLRFVINHFIFMYSFLGKV